MSGDSIQWRSAGDAVFTVNGLWWFGENGGDWMRLPKRAKDVVRPDVWSLAQMPSGGRVRFRSDTGALKVKVLHGGDSIAMWHMSSVACAGIDLYVGPPETTTFWRTTVPASAGEEYECLYFENQPRVMREFTLYLPVYARLERLSIGTDADATIEPPSPFRMDKPIVVYGTSITQGGCSSRVATGFVPLLGRLLGMDVVNLGFSGNGICEPEMAELIAEIDAAAYLIDPVANMAKWSSQERPEVYCRFLEIIRSRRPDTPMILMTRSSYAAELFGARESADQMNAIVEIGYQRRKTAGDASVHYFDTRIVVPAGPDHPSVDGGHLTDVGFKQIADALAPLLAKILTLPMPH